MAVMAMLLQYHVISITAAPHPAVGVLALGLSLADLTHTHGRQAGRSDPTFAPTKSPLLVACRPTGRWHHDSAGQESARGSV